MPGHSNYPSYHLSKYPTTTSNQYRYPHSIPNDPHTTTTTNNPGRTSPQHLATPESLALSRHPHPLCQAALYIPPHAVGAIIGKGGRTILHLQREAARQSALLHGGGSVLVRVPGDPSPWNSREPDVEEGYTPVVVRGDPVGCFVALRRMVSLVDRANDPHVVLEVPVHRSKHGMLLGVRGVVLASLSAAFDVRIMIPSGGGGEEEEDVGSVLLFPEGHVGHWEEGGRHASSSPWTRTAKRESIATPADVIQLEGEIDNVERCLVQMLGIVAGEPYFPTGVVVYPSAIEKEASSLHPGASVTSVVERDTPVDNYTTDHFKTTAFHSRDSTMMTFHRGESHIQAFAVLTATECNDILLSQNKFRSIQRKTNTLIRRKRGRFVYNGVEYGGKSASHDDGCEEKEEGEATLVVNDDDYDNDEEEEEEDVEEEDEEALGGKAPVSFIISGKVENVKAAVQQLERLLGLEADSTVIDVSANNSCGGGETSSTSKKNDAAGVASVENDKKRRNLRTKPKRKPTK